MNSHFHLPKIRTIGDELTLSLAENSHFSFLPSHFPSLPSRRGHHCGAEIRNEFTLSIAKNVFALFVPPLSNGTSRTTSDRKPKTNDQTLPSPIIGSAEAASYYRKRGSRFLYCAWGTFGEREREREIQRDRERERDGSDVTIVALKLAMNSHFHLPKIRTIGDEVTLSLAKNSHFSFLPSHFPSLPSRRGHHCGAEIRNEFTLSIAKNFFALFVPPL